MRRAPVLLALLLLTALLVAPAARADGPRGLHQRQRRGHRRQRHRAADHRRARRHPLRDHQRVAHRRQRAGRVQVGRRGPDLAADGRRPGHARRGHDRRRRGRRAHRAHPRLRARRGRPELPQLDHRRRRQELDRVEGLDRARRPGPSVVRGRPGTTAKTGKPTVYLLYHNLGSGTANHNMYVATSTDGGETFGAAGADAPSRAQTAYADLQCADSGGPSSIAVNPTTGRIYVFFTTRAGVVDPGLPDFGGCAARPAEFNIVNATRVWVATSRRRLGRVLDAVAGRRRLADRPGRLDAARLRRAGQPGRRLRRLSRVAPPVPRPQRRRGQAALPEARRRRDARRRQVVAADDARARRRRRAAATLVHLVAGDPGNVAVAYYRGVGVAGQDKPVWYTHVVHSRERPGRAADDRRPARLRRARLQVDGERDDGHLRHDPGRRRASRTAWPATARPTSGASRWTASAGSASPGRSRPTARAAARSACPATRRGRTSRRRATPRACARAATRPRRRRSCRRTPRRAAETGSRPRRGSPVA